MSRCGAPPWPCWRAGSTRDANSPSEPETFGRLAGDANADVFFQTHRYMSWLADKVYEEWVGEALAFTEEKVKRSPAGLAYLAGIATVFAATGRHDDARRAIEIVAADDFATVPLDMNWLSTIASAAEVCATLGDTKRARTVRSLLEPYADRMVISARAAHHQGSVTYFLARLATAVGDHRAADELYGNATQRDELAGAKIGSSATNGATQSFYSKHGPAGTERTNCSNVPAREQRHAAWSEYSGGLLHSDPLPMHQTSCRPASAEKRSQSAPRPLLSPQDLRRPLRPPGPATRGLRGAATGYAVSTRAATCTSSARCGGRRPTPPRWARSRRSRAAGRFAVMISAVVGVSRNRVSTGACFPGEQGFGTTFVPPGRSTPV